MVWQEGVSVTDAPDPGGLAALRNEFEGMRNEIEATNRIRGALDRLERGSRTVAYAHDLGALPVDGSINGITVDLQSYSLGSADGLACAVGYIRAALSGEQTPSALDALRSVGIHATG